LQELHYTHASVMNNNGSSNYLPCYPPEWLGQTSLRGCPLENFTFTKILQWQ